MKRIALFAIGIFVSIAALAGGNQLEGTWVIEPVNESKEQFPWWMEVKYPKKLTITFTAGEYFFVFKDQFDYECKGKAMAANQGRELVFTFCSGFGTKSPDNWSPVHHVKVVEGKLQGVVTSNRYLFKWVGVRQ